MIDLVIGGVQILMLLLIWDRLRYISNLIKKKGE